MQLINKPLWCFILYVAKFVNCCNRCPEFKELPCKINDEFTDELKSVQEATQEVNGYLVQNLRELQKVTQFLQENSATNRILSSLLPQIMKSKDSLLSSSGNLEESSKLLHQVTDTSKTMQDLLVNQLLRYSENSESSMNVSFHSLQTEFLETFENFTASLTKNLKLELQPFDCYDVLQSGKTTSGVFTIYPKGAVNVFCDLETKGGGWTVFLVRQKQQPHQENFQRSWLDYKDGFGNPSGEYWLGNEALYAMTRSRKYKLMMEAQTDGADDIWGEWETFKIDSESFKYKISLSGLNNESTVYNSHIEGYFNNQKFSTYDSDNDASGSNCASDYKGGWWYNDCKNVNPTGVYGVHSNEGIDFNNWSINDSEERHATWLQLRIRPLY